MVNNMQEGFVFVSFLRLRRNHDRIEWHCCYSFGLNFSIIIIDKCAEDLRLILE